MVKSKSNTFGFWLLAGGIIFFTFLIICGITQYYFNFTIIKIDIRNQRSFNASVVIDLIGCLIFGLILSSRASVIEIDSENVLKTISFKNLFTRQTKIYAFEEFDGYIRTRLWHRQFNENKTICLIKDGKVVRKIDNFFYSNFEELKQGLKDMEYLGYKGMGIVNSWKVFWNQPIVRK